MAWLVPLDRTQRLLQLLQKMFIDIYDSCFFTSFSAFQICDLSHNHLYMYSSLVYYELTKGLASQRGHGFECRSGQSIFQALI